MNRHQICAAVVCFLGFVVSANVAYAQSKNIDKPTPLNSNEIVGSVDSDAKGNTFYYSFWASPGEVSVTLSVTPGKAVNDSFLPALTTTTVEFSLFDRNAEKLADKSATANLSVGSRQAVARVEITRRQLLRLAVRIPSDISNFNSVNGTYRLRVEGAIELGQSGTTNFSKGKTDGSGTTPEDFVANSSKGKIHGSDCLPQQGTLIVKMKDGSKKIIDLSEAESVTVVP